MGGRHFTTSLQTLRREPKSMLATMFAHRDGASSVGLATDGHGAYFIDYDPAAFVDILNYLRNDGSFIVPVDNLDFQRLQRAAIYFQVDGLIEQLAKHTRTTADVWFAKHVVSSSARGVQDTALRTLATIGAFGFRFIIFGLVLPANEGVA